MLQRNQPFDIFGDEVIGLNAGVSVVSRAGHSRNIGIQEFPNEQPANPSPQGIGECSRKSAAAAPSKHPNCDERAIWAEWKHGQLAKSLRAAQSCTHIHQRARPVRHFHSDLVASETPRETIRDAEALNGKRACCAVDVWLREINDWMSNESSIVSGAKVLHVDRIGAHHVPGTFDNCRKRLRGDEIVWFVAIEKRQWKQWTWTVEKEQAAME
jgi:hypothetical protein